MIRNDFVVIPEEMFDEVKEYRSILIEAVADYDENLLEKFMEDENSITEEEINKALKSCCYGYGDYSYDCWFVFKTKVFNSC
jgi:translation elongation factor EF-G